MPPILERFGRLHPLLLHLPIGLLLGALVLEVLVARKKLERAALGPYLWIAALSAVVSASAGWVLGHEDYEGDLFEWHERLGITLSIAAVLAALLHDASGSSARRIRLYRVFLVAACAMLVPAGHLGSQLTHGTDWLDGPRAPAEKGSDPAPPDDSLTAAPLSGETVVDPAPAPDVYATRIAPILAARCSNCHGPSKKKAHLRLDTQEGLLTGGESGPALVPGDPAKSLFLQRAKLPLDHEDHMPPEGKPQPTAEELATLEAWVASGAPFGAASHGTAEPAPGTGAPRGTRDDDDDDEREGAIEPDGGARLAHADEPVGEPPPAALDALDRAFVHHEPLVGNGALLRVEVAAVAPTFGDSTLHELLVPLAPWIGELSLARSAVTDAGVAELARFPHLARLDLGSTAVGDTGLAALGVHAELATLVMARTQLTDAAVETLIALPALHELFVWKSGLSADALARLAAARPALVIHGDESTAAALEAETALAFTSDRPLPGAELVPEALRPVNATCPVSGSPVNPKYAVLHGGRVIGFCCPNCPKEFWADPAKFAAKLP